MVPAFVRQLAITPTPSRVILRSFIPSREEQVTSIVRRALELSEDEVLVELKEVRKNFAFRHLDIESLLERHFALVAVRIPIEKVSWERQLLIGALFSGEYAPESAALFNPSIVPHPNQEDVEPGALRLVMSLRATGEGHVSSLEFRTVTVRNDGTVILLPAATPFASMPRIVSVGEDSVEIRFSADIQLDERIIFPMFSVESNGIEDARFVRFSEQDKPDTYYATYTAYDGKVITPRLIQTDDFTTFHMLALFGGAVKNKGMALFPRKIGGRYAMISRQDDENLFLMYADNIRYWEETLYLHGPRYGWELVKTGNCGSPIETEFGWLLITHGVGPMRKYCIGALLLDLEDPLKVIGCLKEPLIVPEGRDREGYVPNVVYSCGSLVHAGKLVLAYGLSDSISVIATTDLGELLALLRASPP